MPLRNPTQTVQHDQLHDIATAARPPRVLIVDAIAVLQGMKKTCNKRELQNTFIKFTESKIDSYSEGQVIYDHYLDQSLKAKNSSKESININRICSLPGNESYCVNERTSFLIKNQAPSIWHACLLKVY